MEREKRVEIDLESSIKINEIFVVKQYANGFLLYFHNMPNWVVFSKNEFNTFNVLSCYTVGETIKKISEQDVKGVLIKLLSRKIFKIGNEVRNCKSKKILPMHVYLTNKCNLRCIHCYMHSGEALSDELPLADWKKIISGFIEYGGCDLSVSGGEPLLVDFFPDLIKWAKDQKPSLRIKLLTNGIFLHKLPLSFYDNYIAEIQISIDGPNNRINDLVRGQGSFLKVMENLKVLKEYSGSITISMCVLDKYAKSYTRYFERFYNNIIYILPSVKFGIATDLIEGRNYKKLEYAQSKRNLKFISDMFNSTVRKFNTEGQEDKKYERNIKNISCGYGGTLTVTSNGYIYPCGVIHGKRLGYFKEGTISQFAGKLESVLEQFSVNSIEICQCCVLKYVCGGTCRIENYKINGDLKIQRCNGVSREDIFDSIYKDDLGFDSKEVSNNEKKKIDNCMEGKTCKES